MSRMVDLLSICSIIGIWPRFIEPRLLATTTHVWPLPEAAAHLHPLTIVQLSDLHFRKRLSSAFLKRILNRVKAIKPDLILFTGDFLCHSRLEGEPELLAFLQALEAPLGSFCVLGNHDYERYVTRNAQGVYSCLAPQHPLRVAGRTLAQLLVPPPPPDHVVNDEVITLNPHPGLRDLLKKTPFQLLHNETITLPIGLNITGLGDFALGQNLPERAFAHYNPTLPGLVLSHNPASLALLQNYPGDWVFSGHTHGEQIYFPWPKWLNRLGHHIASQECGNYTRGLSYLGAKRIHVTRGLGCHQPFRFCSLPEIVVVKTSLPSTSDAI